MAAVDPKPEVGGVRERLRRDQRMQVSRGDDKSIHEERLRLLPKKARV